MRVALEGAVQLAQPQRLLGVAETVMRTDGVERWRGVALGEDEAVATRIVDRVRPEVQLGAEQAGEQIGARHRAAGMAGTSMIDRRDGMLAHEGSRGGELDFEI